MRIASNNPSAAALPAATKSTRAPHATTVKEAISTAPKAATKTATPEAAAAAAAAPESYEGAGSLLDTHA